MTVFRCKMCGGLSEQIDNKAKKNKDLQDLQEEIARLSSLKDSQANAVKYNELCEQENKAKKKYDEIRAFFPGEVPEKPKMTETL